MAEESVPQDIINRCLAVSEERVLQDIIGQCLRAGQEGKIDDLYRLMREYPRVLEQIDSTPFAETPLHAAASKGNIAFALEIMTLKPSLSRKLNRDGLTPLHLVLSQLQTPENHALQQPPPSPNQQIQRDPNPGTEIKPHPNQRPRSLLIKPTQRPQSLQSLLNKLHPQYLLKQLKLLLNLGPALRFAREAQAEPNPLHNFMLCLLQFEKGLARVKGKGGQTPLHYAAQIGDLQLLEEILINCPMSILDVTVESETALHVALKNEKWKAYIFLKEWLGDASFEDASLWRKKLTNWKDANKETFSDLASNCKSPIRDILVKYYWPFQMVIFSVKTFRSYSRVKGETRSAVLVVFVLLLTLIFQMTITPPGGIWSDDGPSHRAGTAVMGRGPFIAFTVINSFSLLLSIIAIIILLPRAPISYVCTGSLCFLVAYFIMSVCVTYPSPNAMPLKAFYPAFLVPFLYCVGAVVCLYLDMWG